MTLLGFESVTQVRARMGIRANWRHNCYQGSQKAIEFLKHHETRSNEHCTLLLVCDSTFVVDPVLWLLNYSNAYVKGLGLPFRKGSADYIMWE